MRLLRSGATSGTVRSEAKSPPPHGRPAVVEIDSEGFLRLTWAAGVVITEEAAREAAAAVNVLCEGQLQVRPMLVDMAETDSVTRPARAVFTEPSGAASIALLGRSPVDRVVANFVLGVSRLPTPTRYFNDEATALAWLRAERDGRGR